MITMNVINFWRCTLILIFQVLRVMTALLFHMWLQSTKGIPLFCRFTETGPRTIHIGSRNNISSITDTFLALASIILGWFTWLVDWPSLQQACCVSWLMRARSPIYREAWRLVDSESKVMIRLSCRENSGTLMSQVVLLGITSPSFLIRNLLRSFISYLVISWRKGADSRPWPIWK